eukprot:CAMPEP_0115018908 /NCGR_PEP_ID=MMETSP0216-20121206/29116_1 /TAXON_ID=223996 /ORGANISM="Protocruzia adherens, Strain Boccale" /LENGTH=162 /DNA_ID=CAMNT_0002390253 /DNA_START=71 /DNA_END=559 /DNA_ORIENTATION=+
MRPETYSFTITNLDTKETVRAEEVEGDSFLDALTEHCFTLDNPERHFVEVIFWAESQYQLEELRYTYEMLVSRLPSLMLEIKVQTNALNTQKVNLPWLENPCAEEVFHDVTNDASDLMGSEVSEKTCMSTISIKCRIRPDSNRINKKLMSKPVMFNAIETNA